jgi:hypothetical protein
MLSIQHFIQSSTLSLVKANRENSKKGLERRIKGQTDRLIRRQIKHFDGKGLWF